MNRRTTSVVFLTLAMLLLASFTNGQTEPAALPIDEAKPVNSPLSDDTASQLRDWLALPTEKLVVIAREQGFQALAELRAGREMARYETREKSLEQFRLDLLEEADAADQQRAELLQRLESEVEQIRQQFVEDPDECANQISITVRQHRDAIMDFRAQAEACRQLAAQTDSHLKAIRPRLLALNRDYRAIADGQYAAARTSSTRGGIDRSLIESLTQDLQSLGAREGSPSDTVLTTYDSTEPQVSGNAVTVEQALAELESLK